MEEIIDTSSHANTQGLSFEEHFQQAKSIYEYIENLSTDEEKPINELKKLSEFIQMVVDDPSLLEQKDKFKQFFYNKLAKGLLNSI